MRLLTGFRADMWSFGVLVFQLLTGKLPFRGATEYQVFHAISENKYEMPTTISDTARDLLTKLLV